MTKLNHQQATSVLEDRVTKISKAMTVLVKDAPRIVDILDDETLAKTERFLQRRIADLMRDLALARAARPASTVFSLDATEPEPVLRQAAPRVAPPQRSVPQSVTRVLPNITPRAEEELGEDELSQLDVLEVATGGELVDHTPAPPRPKGRPIGRLVGTREPVYGDADEFRVTAPEPGETPDAKTGGIADAGFIDD